MLVLAIHMEPISTFAPAKLNLFLAITGKRPDGFHDLVSVVVQLAFGDTLSLRVDAGAQAVAPAAVLTCNDPEVPVDHSNLVLRAAQAFAAATGSTARFNFALEKRIPMGAGLGGGSSDGAAALRLLNRAAGEPLGPGELVQVAASLGSDCPLFLTDQPVIMRGRGERIETLPPAAAERLKGRRVLVFKPPFGIATAWAYRQLAQEASEARHENRRDVYLPIDQAEARLARWLGDTEATVDELLFNTLEGPAFRKHVALPTMLKQLQSQFGLAPRMTGSGSACFAFLPDEQPLDPLVAAIRDGWGDSAFVIDTRIL